uniref:Uncharacterized protein n=1 Tax=Lotharella globosa TaxID=91324 RepID=A0A7S4E024_9EUKA|mmetsp:Transcript_4665/g.9093  ORF Transcript_4665/g.9093 Transcript_4665/m.9093 type:complete len:443 (-) Transcript_4665:305-1633(-)
MLCSLCLAPYRYTYLPGRMHTSQRRKVTAVQAEREVTALLRRYNPTKLPNVSNLLKKHKGDYQGLIDKIRARYAQNSASPAEALEIPTRQETLDQVTRIDNTAPNSPSLHSLGMVEDKKDTDTKLELRDLRDISADSASEVSSRRLSPMGTPSRGTFIRPRSTSFTASPRFSRGIYRSASVDYTGLGHRDLLGNKGSNNGLGTKSPRFKNGGIYRMKSTDSIGIGHRHLEPTNGKLDSGVISRSRRTRSGSIYSDKSTDSVGLVHKDLDTSSKARHGVIAATRRTRSGSIYSAKSTDSAGLSHKDLTTPSKAKGVIAATKRTRSGSIYKETSNDHLGPSHGDLGKEADKGGVPVMERASRKQFQSIYKQKASDSIGRAHEQLVPKHLGSKGVIATKRHSHNGIYKKKQTDSIGIQHSSTLKDKGVAVSRTPRFSVGSIYRKA